MTDRPSLKMNRLEKMLWAMHMHELAWKVRHMRYALKNINSMKTIKL